MDEDDDVKIIQESDVFEAQKFDAECKAMIKALKRNYKDKPNEVSQQLWQSRNVLKMKNDVLLNDKGKIFIPYKMRHKLLTVAHGSHFGINRTVERLRNRFFWPNVHQSVQNFVQTCRTCSLVKPKYIDPTSMPMLAKAPMEVVACDFIGPLPSDSGFQYALVIIDVYSRYPMLYPLRNLETRTLISKMKNFFSFFGFPNALLSDKGSQFESKEFKMFLDSYNIKKLSTNAYHPNGNGVCERVNRTLKSCMFANLVARNLPRTRWTSAIDHTVLEYRTTIHSALKERPVDVFFAFNVRGYIPHRSSKSDVRNVPINDMRSKFKNKQYFDKKALNREFFVGQEVLVKHPNCTKFSMSGRRAVVVNQRDFHTVFVKFVGTNRSIAVAANRLSPVQHDVNDMPTVPNNQHIQPTGDNNNGNDDDNYMYTNGNDHHYGNPNLVAERRDDDDDHNNNSNNNDNENDNHHNNNLNNHDNENEVDHNNNENNNINDIDLNRNDDYYARDNNENNNIHANGNDDNLMHSNDMQNNENHGNRSFTRTREIIPVRRYGFMNMLQRFQQ